jgi:ABC-type multidrug transport system fused ATPase/permease subunit
MSPFWNDARRMLKYRGRVALALTMAFVSAGGLGAGLVGLVAVLKNILGTNATTLPDLARDFNTKLDGWAVIPDSFIAQLPTDQFKAVVAMVLGLGVLTVIGAAANYLHQSLSLTVSTLTVADIRKGAFARLVRLPVLTVTGGNGVDMVSRIVNDSSQVGRGFQALTNKAVAESTKGAAALIAAFVISWKLSLVTLLVAPILVIVIRKLGKRIRRASRGAMRTQSALLGVATEVIHGFRVVKVHATEDIESARFAYQNDQNVREQLRVRTARALSSPLVEVIAIFVLGGLSLVAAKAIIDKELDPEIFIGAMAALAVAGQALRPLTSVIQDINTASGASDRLAGLERTPIEDAGTNRPLLPRHKATIRFDEVSFTYPGAHAPALRAISLDVRFGERIAVVGGNGSGKTTLLSLVPRLFDPDAGAILIDGVDVRSVSLGSLRSQIGVVPQETVLFRATVAENIAYGCPSATRADIESAARVARADGFISALPEGLDALVGDQGLTLSGGQRQRLAIARALVRNPAILIMDEATSMIDAESERAIADAVEAMGHQRTVLIVAHRLSTVIRADRIAVLDAGRLVDVGTHTELLDRCPAYRSIASHQLQVADSAAG